MKSSTRQRYKCRRLCWQSFCRAVSLVKFPSLPFPLRSKASVSDEVPVRSVQRERQAQTIFLAFFRA
ncbi:uncharacterized protein MYCFIDRAFT_170867 [Pseudocercospora fijiensis CIRAD86]|uniref:Uncharacterized protein n=1 Tax=Pseudocercospora fijiensis (strain CIRAD86) TaxID=383855 RepID=N1Q958_PSEFD|nr:uncharacterized protein MYCFIDRAFT_170867 [Pseudocercospora fijiensis CIRAD86]EME89409.1 hypothetical protein MYCFIDRAFT_170867 [Pseudocercospora fijiensis CIRAD86]